MLICGNRFHIVENTSQIGYLDDDRPTRWYCHGVSILTIRAQRVRRRQVVQLTFPRLGRQWQQVHRAISSAVLSGEGTVHLILRTGFFFEIRFTTW
jgi:hypothetical protein